MFLNKCTTKESLDQTNGRDLEYYLNITKDYKHDYAFVKKQIDGFNVIDDGEFKYGTKTKDGGFLYFSSKGRLVSLCSTENRICSVLFILFGKEVQ